MKASTFLSIAVVALAGAMIVGGCSNDPLTTSVGPALNHTPGASYTQVDRMGIPAINTVFNHPSSADKRVYNTAEPGSDVAAYTAYFEAVLGAVLNDNPQATAAALLPDALPVNLASAVSNFAALDGRKPADDATDVALSVVIGSALSFLHSDNVDTNDVPFPPGFPYLAPPN